MIAQKLSYSVVSQKFELGWFKAENRAWLIEARKSSLADWLIGKSNIFRSTCHVWLKINSMEFVEIMKKTTFNFLKDCPFILDMMYVLFLLFTKFDLTGKESVRGNVNDYHVSRPFYTSFVSKFHLLYFNPCESFKLCKYLIANK